MPRKSYHQLGTIGDPSSKSADLALMTAHLFSSGADAAKVVGASQKEDGLEVGVDWWRMARPRSVRGKHGAVGANDGNDGAERRVPRRRQSYLGRL